MIHETDEESQSKKDGKSDAIAAIVVVLAIVGIAIFWVSNQ